MHLIGNNSYYVFLVCLTEENATPLLILNPSLWTSQYHFIVATAD
jgi:hypothetical protein